jgi:hypothetical protein
MYLHTIQDLENTLIILFLQHYINNFLTLEIQVFKSTKCFRLFKLYKSMSLRIKSKFINHSNHKRVMLFIIYINLYSEHKKTIN